MKKLIAIALTAACLIAADTNEITSDAGTTNSVPIEMGKGPEQVTWQIDSNKIAVITVLTNLATNWMALEMINPNVPKKYIGITQTNRVMWIVYGGKTNELVLDTLWTEDLRIRQAPTPAQPRPQVKK